VEAFYGPEAETLEDNLAVAGKIRLTRDLATLCGLSGPSRRGKRFNWNKDDGNDDEHKQEEESLGSEVQCPSLPKRARV
jgi:hypothetical protein